jgi:hypothetical protein
MEKIKPGNDAMNKQKDFQGEPVTFVETLTVKEGVVCEVYSFDKSSEKDLGIVAVAKNTRTPLQKILKGTKTIEGYVRGEGKLTVVRSSGETVEHVFPGGPEEIELHIGDTMRWSAADSRLIFYEICYPPYEDGRYENLPD